MRVLLDERPCEISADTVMQAISAAAQIAEERGRLIVEIMVDGRAWSNADLDAQQAPQSAEEIRLTSANPIELVLQTLSDAKEALGDADALQQSAAELLQAGNTKEGMNKLGEALSIWTSVQQAMSMGCELADVDLNDFKTAASIDATATIDQLNDRLRSLHAALENNDLIALSDTLLFELPEAVLRWRELLNAICQSIHARREEQR